MSYEKSQVDTKGAGLGKTNMHFRLLGIISVNGCGHEAFRTVPSAKTFFPVFGTPASPGFPLTSADAPLSALSIPFLLTVTYPNVFDLAPPVLFAPTLSGVSSPNTWL